MATGTVMRGLVFSTYVEVILNCLFSSVWTRCILHVCGGDPPVLLQIQRSFEYSPRMWR